MRALWSCRRFGFLKAEFQGIFGSSAAPVDHPKNSDFPKAVVLHHQLCIYKKYLNLSRQ